MNILPVRTHSEKAFRGFMFLIFLSLIAYAKIKKVISNDVPIEQALSLMKNLKCKVYDNDDIIIAEVNKKQR